MKTLREFTHDWIEENMPHLAGMEIEKQSHFLRRFFNDADDARNAFYKDKCAVCDVDLDLQDQKASTDRDYQRVCLAHREYARLYQLDHTREKLGFGKRKSFYTD